MDALRMAASSSVWDPGSRGAGTQETGSIVAGSSGSDDVEDEARGAAKGEDGGKLRGGARRRGRTVRRGREHGRMGGAGVKMSGRVGHGAAGSEETGGGEEEEGGEGEEEGGEGTMVAEIAVERLLAVGEILGALNIHPLGKMREVLVSVRCHSGGLMFSVQGTGGVYKANAFLRRELLAGYTCSESPVARFTVKLEDLVRALALVAAMGTAGPGAPAVRLTYPGPDATLLVAVAGEGGQGFAMDTECVIRTSVLGGDAGEPAMDAFRLEDGGEVVATFVILTDVLRRAIEDLEWLGAKAPVTFRVCPPSDAVALDGEEEGNLNLAEDDGHGDAAAATAAALAKAAARARAPLMPATAVHPASRGVRHHQGRLVLRGGNEWGGAMEVELAWPVPDDDDDERGQDASALSGFSSFKCARPVTHRYVLKHLMQAMGGYTGSQGHGAGGEGGAKPVLSAAHAALSKVKVNEVGEMLIQQMVPFPAGRGWGDDAEAEGCKAFLDFVVLPMDDV